MTGRKQQRQTCYAANMSGTLQQTQRALSVGKGAICLQYDESTTHEFLSGFQVGHLAYIADGWKEKSVLDTDLVLLFVKRQGNTLFSLFYISGILIGWVKTCIREKNTPTLTSKTFSLGYQDGLRAYSQLEKRFLTLGEITALMSYRHGAMSAYNVGYVYGFLEGWITGRVERRVQYEQNPRT